MRQRDAQVIEYSGTIAHVRWPNRQWKVAAFAGKRPQHGVHESCGASLARSSHQIHRIVDDCGGRHAVEVQQLISTEAQDLDDLAIDTVDRAFGKCGDEMVERVAGPLHACGDFRCERAVSVVLDARPCESNRGGKVGAARGDR